MSSEQDNIIEAALQEALGGQTPPDLLSATMAKAQAEGLLEPSATPDTPAPEPAGQVRPGPNWRAWGTGLAAAAVLTLVAIPMFTESARSVDESTISSQSSLSPEAPADRGIYMPLEPEAAPAEKLFSHTRNPNKEVLSPPSPPTTNDPATYYAEPPVVDETRKPTIKAKAAGTNPFVDTEDDALSTFALEHDTGAYAVARAYLNRGELPPSEAIRPEEFINYFGYNYNQPNGQPFSITMDGATSRYGQNLKSSRILRVGVQAAKVYPQERKPAVLTFVVDISGSMDGPERIGLVKKSLRLLVKQLRSTDKVGIAVYGSRGRAVLEHTHNKEAIVDALDDLDSDGSTYAEEGIRIGYKMASDAFVEGAINRVILCSDGVANVGPTDHKTILENIAKHRRKGITLSTVGFGMGNYNDTLMEQLGDKGDGRYAYVDSLVEAKRVFVDNLTGALQVVARDTKVQVEFNPEVVKSWRLLGYENRDVADEDFRNDSVDGGEVGAGHSVTALYEVKLFDDKAGDIAKATIRYKHDELKEFLETNQSIGTRDVSTWDETPTSYRLAATAAEFAELLRKSYWAKGGDFEGVLKEAKQVIQLTDEVDVFELTQLIVKAKDLEEVENPTPTAGGE
ncbi:von Willebrand factor type A domain-containing protein [Planctomycetota bacterium]|nr:von Willebrand factor type A domain-containing protein [Planctomycetota bacterium]